MDKRRGSEERRLGTTVEHPASRITDQREAETRVHVNARTLTHRAFPLGIDRAKKVSGVSLQVFAASESVGPKKRAGRTSWLFVSSPTTYFDSLTFPFRRLVPGTRKLSCPTHESRR